jgi:DNA mismatch repair ATPase MutS
MAQIAQQDNLIIEITGDLAAMDETTKQKLIDCIKVGTITDVIVISTEVAKKVNTGKVLGYMVDTTAAESPKYSVAIMDVNTGTPKKVELN